MPVRKKKKRKKNYVFLCISDAPNEKVKKYHFSRARINFIKFLMTVLFMIILGYLFFSAYHNTIVMGRATYLDNKVKELENEQKRLMDENTYLAEKVSILSDTVNQKVVAEKKLEEKNIPTGFPLSGNADMEMKEEVFKISENEEEIRPYIFFESTDPIFVVAAGAGEVSYVDMDNNFGYQVRIDHGNGYETVYRNGTEPKVKVGDEVARNALLFEMKVDDDNDLANIMAYQIIRDGKYIVPTELLEING